MTLSIKISVIKSLHRGIYPMVFALALMISGQYYFTAKELDARNLTPNIESNRSTSRAISFVLSRINPEFRNVEAGELTVDEFMEEIYEIILHKQAENLKSQLQSEGGEFSINEEQLLEQFFEKQLEGKLSSQQIGMLQQEKNASVRGLAAGTKSAVIEEWKESLSDEVGFRIKGDEKVRDIFVALLNSKINNFVSTRDVQSGGQNIIAAILAVALFLALLPLGSLLARVWLASSWLLFILFKKMGVVIVVKEIREVEVLH